MISRVFLATFALSLAGTVAAQTYPARPIRFIVPFPPGGGNDTMARMIGNKPTAALGQQFVVDNPAGGTPAEFAAHIKRELARWAQVIKQAKIKPD